MVTSPPYNVGKEYDEDFTLEEYLEFLLKVFGRFLQNPLVKWDTRHLSLWSYLID